MTSTLPVPTTELRIDVSAVGPPGVTHCAVEVFAPGAAPLAGADGDGDVPTAVAFCLPGGWYSRRYFDLDVPPALGSYSMARHLASRGIVVVTCDPPAIGGSDHPDDPYALTPDALADVQAAVTTTVLDRLAAGTLVDGLPPAPDALPIGIGHSAGALLTVYEQARHRPFAAVALLGFAGRGLADYLSEEERALADDPEGTRAALPRLVKARFGDALPHFPATTSSIFSGGTAPTEVKGAMRAAQDRLLALLGLTSMIPGASAPELASIEVPVFLGVGDGDITGDPRRIPAHFPAATDITLLVLPGSGHAHNIAARRRELWDRLAAWAGTISPRAR